MYFGFDSITVDYGRKRILDQLTLEIPRGKIVTLIGQNGCGKTTLLKTVSRAVTPKTGQVAQKRVAYRVEKHVGVGMTQKTRLVRYFDTAED